MTVSLEELNKSLYRGGSMPAPTLNNLTPGTDPASTIRRAKELAAIKSEINGLVDATRQQLRVFDKNGALDENQGAWLDVFYPLKGRGTSRDSDSVNATRQAHEAAIREVTAGNGNVAQTQAEAKASK